MSNITQEDADRLVERLKKLKPTMIKHLEEADVYAQDILKYYQMFTRCPEAGSYTFTMEAINDYERAHGLPSSRFD